MMTKRKKTFHQIILDGIKDDDLRDFFAGLPCFNLSPLLEDHREIGVPSETPIMPPFRAMWCEWRDVLGEFRGMMLAKMGNKDADTPISVAIQHFREIKGERFWLPIFTYLLLHEDGRYAGDFEDRTIKFDHQLEEARKWGCNTLSVDPAVSDKVIDILDEHLNKTVKDANLASEAAYAYARDHLSGVENVYGLLYSEILREHIILKFALALMNVKNIEIVEPKNPSVSRIWKRNRHKKDRFHTLRIRPGS